MDACMSFRRRCRRLPRLDPRGSTAAAAMVALLVVTAACSTPAATPARTAPTPLAPQSAQTVGATAPSTLPRMRTVYTSDSATDVVLWVAQEAGLFAKQGLDVEVSRIGGGSTKVIQSMVAGEVDVAHIGGSGLVDAVLAGADLVAIATILPSLGMSLYAVPDVRRMEDLRGRAIGITRAGSISDVGARMVLTRNGLRPDTDVGLVQTGGTSESLAAMQAGATAGGILFPPTDVPARQLGFHELLDLNTLGVEFPLNTLIVERGYMARNEEALRRFMRAYVEAAALTHRDPAFAKQVLAKYTHTDEDEALESGYQAYGNRYLATAPYPKASQFQTILDFMGQEDPRVRELQADRFVDDHFVRELDQQGVIAALNP
jgi:NitT/TauT family transport system substrate-binding protein